MLDDIGRELRSMTNDMLEKLETAVRYAGIKCYNVDKAAGAIFAMPVPGSRIKRIIIRPLPLTMKVSVVAEMNDNSSCKCAFTWGSRLNRDLSAAVRKAINGG